MAKLTEEDSYTIVQDYLGTPIQAFDSKREVVWDCLLDIYGEVQTLGGERGFVPFRFQGQYEDEETGLYYNRFRYYSPQSGNYISQDPIRLEGNNPTLYAYTHDSNWWIDPLGLDLAPLRVQDFNQAMRDALNRLKQRGFSAESPTLGKFGDIAKRPVGMQTMDGKVGFRVEYDIRSGAHINVWSGKEKGPHFVFDASEKTVSKIQRRYKCKR